MELSNVKNSVLQRCCGSGLELISKPKVENIKIKNSCISGQEDTSLSGVVHGALPVTLSMCFTFLCVNYCHAGASPALSGGDPRARMK